MHKRRLLYEWLLIARTVSAAISALSLQNSYRHYLTLCGREREFKQLAKRRAAVLSAILQDLDDNIVENYQVRSRHLVLVNLPRHWTKSNIDWDPTFHLGHTVGNVGNASSQGDQ